MIDLYALYRLIIVTVQMEQNRTGSSEASGTNSEMANRRRIIRQWRERCQQRVNEVADDALETNATAAVTEESFMTNLNTRLIERLGFDSQIIGSELDDYDFAEYYAEYGGDDGESSMSTLSQQQHRPEPPSRQMSITSSASGTGGQAIHIKREPYETHPCYKDLANGVMALNGNELVFADWHFQGDGTGELQIHVGSLHNEIAEGNEEAEVNESIDPGLFQIIPLLPEFRDMRAVDLEYAPCLSAYIIGLNGRKSSSEKGSNLLKSLLCLFDFKSKKLTPWVPRSKPHEDFGLVHRIYCALEKPVIYVITNNRGVSTLLLMNEEGVVSSRKVVSDLFSDLEFGAMRLVDVACSGKNDLVAIAYNSSTKESEGPFGVRLWNPNTWERVNTLKLGDISVPYSVPRLTWVHQPDMFALVNQSDGELCVFNRAGIIQGDRSFTVFVEGYKPPAVFPINICAAKLNFVAIRYSRFINIHRVLP